ncbi:MAG: hypothetical protein Fur0015_09190 [Ignavibacteriales bacterium]
MEISNIFRIIEAFNEPAMILQADSICLINSALRKFFSIDEDEIIGKNFIKFLSQFTSDKLKTANFLRSILEKKEKSSTFLYKLNFLSDGNNSVPIKIENLFKNFRLVKFDSINFMMKEVETKHEAEKNQLKKLINEARNLAEQTKKIFLYQISHEIRTPLSAILSFASLIKEELREHIKPDLETGFEVISRGGDRVIRTVDLMLNMSEVLTNSYRFNPQKLDFFTDVFYSIFNKNKKYAIEKEIYFEYENELKFDTVWADEFMLQNIIDNIINNAIKFTNDGGVKIKLFNNENGNLVCEVSDTGIGISEEYMDRIFQAFTQEDEGTLRKFDGNGLGLSLTKRYCEINNIKFNLQSKKNSGCKVTLEFPMLFDNDARSDDLIRAAN